jgi:hypothetical protein
MTIELIRDKLVIASERQAEFADNIIETNKKITELERQLKTAKRQYQLMVDFQDAPRNEAKALAKEFIESGGDESDLPRALSVRTRTKQEYNIVDMLIWLANNHHYGALSIKKSSVKTLLKTKRPDFVEDTEVIEITCDIDLTWMTE